MELFLGFIYLFIMAGAITGVATLIGDIIMMKIATRISWRESVRCGWLYFIDRFRK